MGIARPRRALKLTIGGAAMKTMVALVGSFSCVLASGTALAQSQDDVRIETAPQVQTAQPQVQTAQYAEPPPQAATPQYVDPAQQAAPPQYAAPQYPDPG